MLGLAGATVLVLILIGIWVDPDTAGRQVGYLVAATVAPLVLAGLVFWFCQRQEAIDRLYGDTGN